MAGEVASRRQGQRGVTMVEFALVGVVFFMLLIGVFEVGRLLYGLSTMTNAAREGARYAVASANTLSGHTNACDNTTPGVTDRVRNQASGVAPITIDVITNVDVKGDPQSCSVTVDWAYKPASGFFDIFAPHTFSSESTLYFQNNLR